MQDHHSVSVYDHDHQVVDTVTTHVAEGLAAGERVVVIISADHAAELERSVPARGVALAQTRAEGRLVVLDAASTLAGFMDDGIPDPDRFVDTVGGVLADVGADGTPVRAFGEMVALLWEEGNIAGAVRLEELWNELAQVHVFSLLCAYPSRAFATTALRDLKRVCALHDAVEATYAVGPPTDGRDTAGSAVFVPVPQAVAAARRFVSAVLESWGEQELLADAAVVTSELATNAVRHAASPFRAAVDRSRSGVRISITDVEPGRISAGAATHADLNGRGVAIVDALASRWGCDPAPDGKVVWAELRAGAA